MRKAISINKVVSNTGERKAVRQRLSGKILITEAMGIVRSLKQRRMVPIFVLSSTRIFFFLQSLPAFSVAIWRLS